VWEQARALELARAAHDDAARVLQAVARAHFARLRFAARAAASPQLACDGGYRLLSAGRHMHADPSNLSFARQAAAGGLRFCCCWRRSRPAAGSPAWLPAFAVV
jgi:hypothetical protein